MTSTTEMSSMSILSAWSSWNSSTVMVSLSHSSRYSEMATLYLYVTVRTTSTVWPFLRTVSRVIMLCLLMSAFGQTCRVRTGIVGYVGSYEGMSGFALLGRYGPSGCIVAFAPVVTQVPDCPTCGKYVVLVLYAVNLHKCVDCLESGVKSDYAAYAPYDRFVYFALWIWVWPDLCPNVHIIHFCLLWSECPFCQTYPHSSLRARFLHYSSHIPGYNDKRDILNCQLPDSPPYPPKSPLLMTFRKNRKNPTPPIPAEMSNS